MATTTNYGWTTPDDTALVKDGASAIRSLGTSVDTTTKNLNPETTLGDIAYRSSTANVKTRLGIGTTGQILSVVGGVPAWASPAGGGKVLQVVYGGTITEAVSSTTTFIDTNLTASITPSSATSKVLVLVSQNGCRKNTGNSNSQMTVKLFRGATEILVFGGGAGFTNASDYNAFGSLSAAYLDTPATTSATTYKTQFHNGGNAASVSVQTGDGATSTIVLLEIGA
jgi:hypothetical protein